MTLDEYLERFIEGYLFEDLRSMASIKLAPGKKAGAVGYPMVMTALSGIEVLGVLTSRASFHPKQGRLRFDEFWRDYVYSHRPDFQGLDELAYQFVRHGLAHSFMTKPNVEVTKHREPRQLCLRDVGVLMIDALNLHDDLEIAYFDRLKPNINGDLKTNMETRFREFAYWNDHTAKKHLFDKVPLRPVPRESTITRTARISSPSVHSTNFSTTGFDDPNR